MSNGEKVLQANGVDLCVETFGSAGDPAVLLIHGASASMLWWEADLCERIAAAGRFVIRYDNRDTGRSTYYPVGQPGYSLPDMGDDAIGVLDGLGVERACLVGRSMAGAIALTAEAKHSDRVSSLVLVNTTNGEPGLPPPSDEFIQYTSGGSPAFDDRAAVVDFIVGLMRIYSGPSVYFDEDYQRAIAEADYDRAASVGSTLVNHFAMDTGEPEPLAGVRKPTLIVQGEADPVYSMPHGEALHKAIPGSRLLVLDKAGHEVPPQLFDVFAKAVAEHSAAG